MTRTLHICNDCNHCSASLPQPLNWGHECWAYTEDGRRIDACESHIAELPALDSDVLEAKSEDAK